MPPDLWSLYALMLKSRLIEEGVSNLWHDGLISGEMHLGTGEEAIIAAVVSQLREGDAMALDHRGTSALLMRGVDPVLLIRELLGRRDGLCGGMGGHMHLFSKEHLAASSGIVGAAGPAACGFAFAAQYLRPGSIAVAFFGDGAVNQGMLMESMNLSSVWDLPVLFVCKDDGWAITTRSEKMTGGNLGERARGLGISYFAADGLDVSATWEAARFAIERARSGQGPSFLHARCVHLEGHFLGFQLIRAVRNPLGEMPGIAASLTKSLLRRRRMARSCRRAEGSYGGGSLHDPRPTPGPGKDPLTRLRSRLDSAPERLQEMEDRIGKEAAGALASALGEVST